MKYASIIFILALVSVNCVQHNKTTTAPDASLDTLPVIYFGGNSAERPKANIEMLSKMRIVVIEKWEGHCWDDCVANNTAGIPCDPACHEENIQLSTLQKVKTINPKVSAVFYLNTMMDFVFYDLHAQYVANDALLYDAKTNKPIVLENDQGMKPVYMFDLGKQVGRDLWLNLVKNLVGTGYVDGIFGDKWTKYAKYTKSNESWNICNNLCGDLTQEQALAYNSGKEQLINDTMDFLGEDAVFWYDSMVSIKSWDKKDAKDLATQCQDSLKTAKYVYYKLADQHTTHDPNEYYSICSVEQVIKFLLSLEKGAFLGCDGWDEMFDYPLGDPTNQIQEDGKVYYRNFTSGTSVEWNNKKSTGNIYWSNGNVTSV